MSASGDFWLASGHHLLDRDAAGRLLVTDEFLKVYLARPELVPPPEACAAERTLHHILLRDPRQPVAAAQVAAIADTDARENWATMIGWRDHLVKHRTLEAAYLEMIRRNIRFPHVLIGQLTQAILRNMLDDCEDVFMLRAAEMLFRPQKLLLGLCLAMTAVVAVQHFFLLAPIADIGRRVDYLPASDPEIVKFWRLHGVYSGLDIAKILLGFIFAARLTLRWKPDRDLFVREYGLGAEVRVAGQGKMRRG